ncbi:Major facilitator superfamily domain, general substrate transporter [Metarhizium rileyi]|uniref:Major facilitator superfamily domain, general substrate transporter n=1 Tax=Metarhizium rileyi (strain RCEF 4871) TaxID=1649241 RepID=A0A167KPM4_METRR|nr:Major facilitator superfamily domain, general substrate transporter [Metarhizium rileyi RCEF 4871]
MSLAQHLTPEDGFDLPDCQQSFENTVVNARHWRRMSFDAFAPEEEPRVQTKPLRSAAYKTSTLRRVAQVGLAVVFCVLASGILFGFAALKPILIAQGVYSELCLDNNSRRSQQDTTCPEQDLRLNLLFTTASITTNVSSLFAGYILDTYHRRICTTLAAAFLALGALFFISHRYMHIVDGFILSSVFLGLGGTFLFLPSFQLSNAFPKYSGVVVALVTCSFDASSAVFLVYQEIWKSTDGRFTPERFFTAYLLVPAAILVAEWTVMPKQRYHTMPELEQKLEEAHDATRDIHISDDELPDDLALSRIRSQRAERRKARIGKIENLTGGAEERHERLEQRTSLHVYDEAWGVLHGLSVKDQVKTLWFILLLINTAFQMLRMNYFIATISSQYSYMLGKRNAEQITAFFNAALPIGGIAVTPIIAVVLNTLSVAGLLIVLTVYVAAIGILNCVSHPWAGFATVLCFVTFRPFYYSATSHIAAKVFGYATFGRIYGTIICLSGVVNFLQPAIDTIANNGFDGDPFPVNAAMAAIGVALALVFTAFVTNETRNTPKRAARWENSALLETREEYGTIA